ncbi:19185_t:CDS:2 [Gigaspora rosea]|nr:19185_t:CDS:2 [Gigaspora rosea]
MSSDNQDTIFCFLCGQQFKTPGGLARHNTIIKKYNKASNNVKRIPKQVLKEFKQTLVFLIHKKLSNNFNHMGRQKFEKDIDPLLQLATKTSQKKYRKSKFTYGEVLVEWRRKKKIEEDGTVCIAGFIYIHFYIDQKRILM